MPVGRTKPRSLMPRSRLGCKFRVVNDKTKILAERSGVLEKGDELAGPTSLSPASESGLRTVVVVPRVPEVPGVPRGSPECGARSGYRFESKAVRVAANGAPAGRGGVGRDQRFWPSTR